MKLIVSFVLLAVALATTSIAVPAPTTKDLNLALRGSKAGVISDATVNFPHANEQDEDQRQFDGDRPVDYESSRNLKEIDEGPTMIIITIGVV